MKRIIYVFVSLIICFSLGVGRIIYINYDETYTASADNSRKSTEIGKVRGTIFDCGSVRLTNTEYEYFAAVPPNADGINAVADYIDETNRKTLAAGFPVTVKVNKQFYSDSVVKVKLAKRYSGIASHLIGYCNENGDGICGIEQAYNDILKRETVKVSFDTDATGAVIGNSEQIENDTGYEGNGVMLTIDKSIQTICEQVAEKYIEKGAVVVLENSSGKIRACVSAPDYDPNDVSSSLDSPSSPFYNRALAAYNCGSVFKLCVAAAALYYNVNLTTECKGSITVGDTVFNCLAEHKNVDMKTALAVSCNCYFIELGQKIGASRLLSFAKSMGFGNEISLCSTLSSTGATLPELYDLQEKSAELANFSFGQGVIMTSPLQIASMVQCIANGGKLIKPSLIKGITDSNGKLIDKEEQTLPTYILDESDAKTLCEYMVNTVENGTGKAAEPLNSGAGGKTATAQTGIYDEQGNAVYQTWFGGFYPAENPVYTIVVLCENGDSGGSTAAPIFKEIADNIYGIR